jgi:hypothetical protein
MHNRELKQDRTVPHSSQSYRDEWDRNNANASPPRACEATTSTCEGARLQSCQRHSQKTWGFSPRCKEPAQ